LPRWLIASTAPSNFAAGTRSVSVAVDRVASTTRLSPPTYPPAPTAIELAAAAAVLMSFTRTVIVPW
jgi:hypothetical protein